MLYILVKHNVLEHKKKEFHQIYKRHLERLEKHGGKVVGDFDIEMGPYSEHFMIWTVKDWTAYEKTLHDLWADPDEKEFDELGRPLCSNSQRWLLRPTDYSPLK